MRGSARRTAMPRSKQQEQPARKRRTAAQAAPRFQAVIFLGASAVSMMVAETTDTGNRVVDVLSQPVNLAQDVFNGGIVTRETMDRCVQIAQGYTTLLDEYRKAGEMQVRLLATNILLDVHNMDTLVNRLQISCGLELEVMDDGEMTRLLYLSMQEVLEQDAELQGQRVLVLHVGPGNTRLLLFDKGRISYYASYRMGAHRTGISIARQDSDTADECSRIREHIRGNLEQIFYDIEPVLQEPPDALVVFGPDFHRLQSPLAGGTVTEESLGRLADEIAETPASQRMERYREDFAAMPAVLPTVVICLSIIRGLEPARIICPGDASSQLAFLANLMPSQQDDVALEEEVAHFSMLLANRYRVDRAHSQHIRRLSMALFDQLKELHGLSRHDRLLLKVACILHEVGSYISPKNHHHHSQYIILNSEIFGLSRRDVEIVGLLARYHRHGAPTTRDHGYSELDLDNRLRVQKLASILRVAEAMERAHSHRITRFSTVLNGRRLEIRVPGIHDLALENSALRSKGAMFTDIFGYDIILIPGE